MTTRIEKRQFTAEPREDVEPVTLAERLDDIDAGGVSIMDGCVLVSGPSSEWGSESLIEALDGERRLQRATWVTFNDTTMDAVIHYYERIDGELTKIEDYTAFGHARAYDYVCREYGFDVDEH